ncbi:glycosyltransferase family 2 protein [Candidatus Kuenenbacteria bacterium]|nr:glycosyltransferase family 2 protein [Candidatus Kuenenbacteria bacterium]
MVSVCIVTYNSMKYLPYFLDSIFHQSYWQERGESPDIFIVDNASSDKTVEYIRTNFPAAHLLRNVNNIGLSRAWNQAIKMTHGEYLLIMNPDVILDEKFLSILVKDMEDNADLGSAGGKLYQLDFEKEGDYLIAPAKTTTLDSCGLLGYKSRRFVDRGAGEKDLSQYNQKEEVFGISGACLLVRRSALERLKFGEEYFDESFFMYQEDIDLAWRLQLSGYRSIYDPAATAWHHRRARSGQKSQLATLKYRRDKENLVNFHSYKNHLMLLYKNEFRNNFFLDFPHIFWYELKKFLYVLIFEAGNFFRCWTYILKNRGLLRQKRRLGMKLKRVRPEEVRQWFLISNKQDK